jgi:CO/xanthine dehydrogenase FAD-binding subunit
VSPIVSASRSARSRPSRAWRTRCRGRRSAASTACSATIGGSVSHADPSADYLPVLLACGAGIILENASRGRRQLPAAQFFIDFMVTAKEPDELVTAIRVPKLPAGWGSAYIRFARVEGSFAIVGAAAVLAGDRSSATVALGGVGPRPVVLDVTAQLAGGVDQAALAAVGQAAHEASQDASGDPLSDAAYRREMASVYARRACAQAAAQVTEVGA